MRAWGVPDELVHTCGRCVQALRSCTFVYACMHVYGGVALASRAPSAMTVLVRKQQQHSAAAAAQLCARVAHLSMCRGCFSSPDTPVRAEMSRVVRAFWGWLRMEMA